MTTTTVTKRSWMSLFAAAGVASCLAFVPASADAANPVAKPNVQTSSKLPAKAPGEQIYVLQMGKVRKQVTAKKITVERAADGKVTKLLIDGKKFAFEGTISIAIATGGSGTGTGTCTNTENKPSAYGQSTTTTQLPAGGTRTDIDHGNGSSTTIIHDPHGGKNGGSSTTVSSDDGEGNTTTTTTTTDGSNGSSSTTVSTTP